MPRKGKNERRRALRANAEIPLEIKKEKGVIEARTENISSSGAYCTLDRFVPLNTELNVSLILPDEDIKEEEKAKRVTCHGIVVRTEPTGEGDEHTGYGMAICFTDLARRDREKIKDYVIRKLPEDRRKLAARRGDASESYDPGEVFVTGAGGDGGLNVSSANFRVMGDEINISKNGICCRTDRQIPLFREIAVNLVLPPESKKGGDSGAEAVQCSAVVVGCEKIPRSKKYDFAAYFVGLSREQKERLEACIKKIL